MERAIESEEARESVAIGRGMKATLVVVLVGAAVVMSAILFVTLAPMAGIELPGWVPTFAKLTADNDPGGALVVPEDDLSPETEPIVSADTIASDSASRPSEPTPGESESVAGDPPDSSGVGETVQGTTLIVDQIRLLLASGDAGSLERAMELIDDLPADASISAVFRKSAEDLRLFRSIVGTL